MGGGGGGEKMIMMRVDRESGEISAERSLR
jgi:hypothetical protein